MKYSTYIVIALLALLIACTKAELCDETEHPHRAGVRFDYDWSLVNSDARVNFHEAMPNKRDTVMLTIIKRIVGTEITGCCFNLTKNKGYYLTSERNPKVSVTVGFTDWENGDDDTNESITEGTATPVTTSASTNKEAFDVDLFKIRPGTFKMVTVNRDTTEFNYTELYEYLEHGLEDGTTLHELCVEYKRYKYGSEKLRNQVPGWQDYNIYGDADNFLQPDLAPIYYDSIAPCDIARNSEQTFTFRPVLLTQNIDIRFHVRKKVDVEPFLIDSICAEISGIPYRLNLSRDVFDIRNTAKMRFMCKLEDGNGNVIDDTPTNEYLLCHGNIDVLSLVNAPNSRTIRGPGIMQLMVKIKDHKTIRVKVNLFNAIERANLYRSIENGEWAVRRKSHGVLEIDTNLVIDEKAVLPSDQGNGMEEWIQANEDDIVVDT
jgi:hypothetical protein